MEFQRSLSFKHTRFLLFSFTIPSSIIFLTFSTSWFLNSTPLTLKDTSFELKITTPLSSSLPETLTLRNSTGNSSLGSLESAIPEETHVNLSKNISGLSSIFILRKENEPKERNFTVKPSVPETSLEELQLPAGEEEEEFEENPSEIDEVPNGEELVEDEATSSSEIVDEPPSKGRINEEKRSGAALIPENIGSLRNGGIKEKSVKECDVTKGKWVYDESYPFYCNNSCPFIDEGFDCAGNGRLDEGYTKWRWQPQECDIPRFNATKMLDSIRGKRLVFVGDSINRNQWESMLCLLMGAVKDPKRVYETRGRRITKEKGNYSFKFVDYGCTVEYYVTHFLVHESKARLGRKRIQTLRIDAIDHGSSRWRGADILIFNTAHWWSHFKTKAGINYYQEGSQVHPKLDVSVAFRRALMTWASWVDKHIKPRKTRVFFRSSAPSHFSGGQWNSGGHCREATQPINETLGSYHEKNTITEDIIRHMKTPVTFLNITGLSEFRIDGHPSVYGRTPVQGRTSRIQDCSHWCLPGVPDTWNELLYYHLQIEGDISQ